LYLFDKQNGEEGEMGNPGGSEVIMPLGDGLVLALVKE